MKNITLAIFSALIFIFCNNLYSQYYHHGVFKKLFITSDFLGYWADNYLIGDHGSGYKLYRQSNWIESTVIKEEGDAMFGYLLDQSFFINDSIGFIVEGRYGSSFIYITLNFGESWSLIIAEGTPYNNKLYFLDASTGYYAFYPGSPNQSFIIGYGNGNSWQSTDYQLDSQVLYFINESMGFVSTKDTVNNFCLLRTIDNGISWENNFCDSIIAVNDIRFYNSDFGFFIGDLGIIMKSINGGDSWEQINISYTDDLNCIRFFNEDELIIVGDLGTVLLSHDSGNTWEKEDNNLESNLMVVTITDTRLFIQDEGWNLYSNKEVGIYNTFVSEEIALYPNPTKEVLNISGLKNKKVNLKVYNSQGELVAESEHNDQINVSSLNMGLFILNIELSNGNSIVKKCLKFNKL